MGIINEAATEIAKIFRKFHFNYDQTKEPVKLARQMVGLDAPRVRKGTVVRLSLEEEHRFIEEAYRQSGARGLMLTTLLETGARVSEFCHIFISDVSFEERLITIRSGKGSKRREIPIREELARMLRVHVGDRSTGYLFESNRHDRFRPRRMQTIVKEVADAAGIQKRVYPHLLRHTIATRLINAGMPEHLLQSFLGHSDPKTTQIYAVTETSTMRAGFDAAMK